jgi:Putative peptidoglycan binding domain
LARSRLAARASRAVAVAALVAGLAATLSGGAVAAGGGTTSGGGSSGGGANPYRDDGMWIWYVSRSSGGNLAEIAHRAHRHGIETVYIKSSDGSNAWSQFTPSLVSTLHAHHLRVCAWQFVYGTHPGAEARRGAQAVAKGADCLVIDAESTYEGRYRAADIYVDKLRNRVGAGFPTGLASFPYVDYHPSLPYSVFLGHGGARFNLPQLYWHTIGDSVRAAYRHTFRFNRVYGRPIDPLGQTYAKPPIRELQRFRKMAISYGFDGVSWWVWQDTTKREWQALGHNITTGVSGFQRPDGDFPTLASGSRGDLVVWAQEHLRGAGESVRVSGLYRSSTVRAVKSFQRDHGLAADGRISTQTWRQLLDVAPQMVDWSHRGTPRSAKRSGASEPRSAGLPAVRYEIPPPSQRH